MTQTAPLRSNTITLQGKERVRIFYITPQTRVHRDGKPAKLEEVVRQTNAREPDLVLMTGDLIDFVIGNEWDSALPLLQAFGVVAAVGHIAFNWDAYFRAIGNTKPLGVASLVAAAT